MSGGLVRINELPNEDTPSPSDKIAIDGVTTRGTTIQQAANAAIPVASQAEAEAGADNAKRMTALRTKQHVDARIGDDIQPLLGDGSISPNMLTSPFAAAVQWRVLTGAQIISGGVLSLDINFDSFRIDTEGSASLDDLTNIVQADGVTEWPIGSKILLFTSSSGRDVNVKHDAGGAGEILGRAAMDITMNNANAGVILYKWSATQWIAQRYNVTATAGADLLAQQEQERIALGIAPLSANTMLVDNAAGTARETKTFSEVRTLLDLQGVDRTLPFFGAVGDGVADDTTAVNSALAANIEVDGLDKIYSVTALPENVENLKRAALLTGSQLNPTKNFKRVDLSRITTSNQYKAWPQAKAYKVFNQRRMWLNEKQSHTNANARIVLHISDDGFASWDRGSYLDDRATGRTLWSAGFDGVYEYLFVRVPDGGTADVPPYVYEMWKREIVLGDAGQWDGAWTITSITFPMPVWAVNPQPIMIHDFWVGKDGALCVGGSLGNGTGVYRSVDGGTTWTFHQLVEGNGTSEPTGRYDPAQDIYEGFLRRGGGNPQYWRSNGDFSGVQVWTAPADFFGLQPLSASTISFDLDAAGGIHAVCAFRNGVLEGAGTDEHVSVFYLTAPAFTGSFWSVAQSYRIGQFPRREPGGASALGQGAVIVDGDKVALLFGFEERTGASGGAGRGGRVTNIAQCVVFLSERIGWYDLRTDLLKNRGSDGLFTKIGGLEAWAIPTINNVGRSPTIISGRPNFAICPQTIFVISNSITISSTRFGYYRLDTQGGSSLENLNTIIDTTAKVGDEIVLEILSGARRVNLTTSGNIRSSGAFLMENGYSKVKLIYTGINNSWDIVSARN